MGPRIMFALMDIFPAVLFILISLPLILEKIPPNAFYGFRIRKAFLSDENWYQINQYGGKALTLWSLPLLASGVMKFFLPIEEIGDPWNLILLIGPLIIFTTVAIIQTLIYARKL